jgi:hypothetical protein
VSPAGFHLRKNSKFGIIALSASLSPFDFGVLTIGAALYSCDCCNIIQPFLQGGMKFENQALWTSIGFNKHDNVTPRINRRVVANHIPYSPHWIWLDGMPTMPLENQKIDSNHFTSAVTWHWICPPKPMYGAESQCQRSLRSRMKQIERPNTVGHRATSPLRREVGSNVILAPSVP